MSLSTTQLLEGWEFKPLTEVATVIMGQSPPGSTYNTNGRGLPFFQGKAEFGADHPTARKWCTAPTRVAEKGDLLMSVRAPVGPTNVADRTCAVGRGLAIIRAHANVPTDLIRHAISMQEDEIASWGTGTTFTAINKAHFGRILIPLPPENLRDGLAELISRTIDRRRESSFHLGAARRAIERFRQSVLAAACSGRLTADWRELYKGESGQDLAVQLAEPKNLSAQRGWKVFESKEELAPESWGVVTFGALTINHDGRRVPVKASDRKQRRGLFPYYGASGVIDHVDDFLFDGDFLLVSEDGANLLARVTPIAFRAQGRFWVNNHAHVVEAKPGVLDAYLEMAINGRDIQGFVTGSAQPKLTQAALNALPIFLPSSAEQAVIVRHVERLLALAESFKKRIDVASKAVSRSSQAVLAKAFRGELSAPDGISANRREGQPQPTTNEPGV